MKKIIIHFLIYAIGFGGLIFIMDMLFKEMRTTSYYLIMALGYAAVMTIIRYFEDKREKK